LPVSPITFGATKAVIAFQTPVFAFASEKDEESFKSGAVLDLNPD
jgi:hypothetical protein